jgi:hypothetical protein
MLVLPDDVHGGRRVAARIPVDWAPGPLVIDVMPGDDGLDRLRQLLPDEGPARRGRDGLQVLFDQRRPQVR